MRILNKWRPELLKRVQIIGGGTNGLSAMVEHELRLDPFAHAAYVFGNRRKDRIKILGWSRNGFWLLQKRLENARFVWPREDTAVPKLIKF